MILAIVAGVAYAVTFCVVKQKPVTIRAGIVGTGWQRADFGHLHLAVEMQKGIREQAAQIYPGAVNVDHVDVIFIDR